MPVTQKRIAEATPAAVRDAAARWLSDGLYVLEVQPFPEYATTPSTVDRSAVPKPGASPAVRFPKFERATLANGIKLVVAERQSVPQVNVTLLVDSGYAADQLALPGTASLALDMMDEGTTSRSALQIAEELAGLGATLASAPISTTASVSLSALKDKLDPSLAIFGDVVLNPSFPADELERLRRRRIAQIQQEAAQPIGIALRVLPGLIYGPTTRTACRSRLGHDRVGRQDHPRDAREVPRRLVQALERDDRRGRRDDHGGDQAADREAVRVVEAGRRYRRRTCAPWPRRKRRPST